MVGERTARDRASLGREHAVVLPVRTDPTGRTGPTRHDVTTGRWRRSSRGLYVPSDVAQTPEQRIVEVGVLLPRHCAVTGWSALRWLGGRWFDGTEGEEQRLLPVTVAASMHHLRPQPGFTICQERLRPPDLIVVDGLSVTTAARSLAYEVRYAGSLREAISLADMAAFHDLVSVEELRTWVDDHPSYTGIQRGRDTWPLVDENAWSPTESALRQAWWQEARQPLPLSNRPVFDLDGRHLATPDVVDAAAGVYGEYDGAAHLTSGRRAIDVRREAALRAHGLEGVVMTRADLRDRSAFVVRLQEAYGRAQARAGESRTWTLDRPAWWPDTTTVAARRALAPDVAARWLRNRSG